MISTIKAVFVDIWRFFMPPITRKKIIRLVALLVIIFITISTLNKGDVAETVATALPPTVFVSTVDDLEKADSASFVGTVRAVNEAQILAETSGRVTAVYATPGDEVAAGTILASLENASAQAALLQAQGAYEAALAAAAQSEVSVEDARNSAISAYRSAYTTVHGVVLNTADVFFSDPDSRLIPGVRINSGGNSTYLNNTRKSLNTVFETWRKNTNLLSSSDDLTTYLAQAELDTQTVIDMVDVLIEATSKADAGDTLDGSLVNSYTSNLTIARTTLNGALASLSSATENLNRAEIAGTQNTEVSLANAQVKQALGALRSAQAMYEKTIFRSPITGTVNSLSINVGDFVNAFTQVAEVANNEALEISIFVGEKDFPYFSIGDEVKINEATKGVVTSVAPAIDPATQKTEIKVAAESTELTNGSTVSITIDQIRSTNTVSTIYLPITAIKFEATDGYVFTVEDGVLVSRPVSLGSIQGSSVEVTGGIDMDTVFVIDARGLSKGQEVEAIRNN